LAEPRWSFAPHFDGQRSASAGGRHDWAWTVIAARMYADAMTMGDMSVVTGRILIPPRCCLLVFHFPLVIFHLSLPINVNFVIADLPRLGNDK
jgi:hypothetical protein